MGRCASAITFAIVKLFPEPVIPSSVWKRSPFASPRPTAAIASGWSPAGARSVTRSNKGTEREYRRGETATFSTPGSTRPSAPVRSAGAADALLEICPDFRDLILERREITRRCRRPTWPLSCVPRRLPAGRSGGGRRTSAHAAFLEPIETGLERSLDDDHGPVLEPTLGLHEQRHVVDHHRRRRRFGDPPQELLADRGMRDRLELFAVLVIDERDRGQRRAVERSVGLQDRRAELFDELG